MKFPVTLQLAGKTATGFEVPAEIVSALGAGKRPPVKVTIGKHTYRSTIAPMGGVFMVGVSAENRQAAGVAAGDRVEVDLELDTEPREVTVPADFAAALDREPAAKQRFESLSYSHKREHVMAVEGAKTDETRQRRISKAITILRETKR
ncbi:MAG TPA: YdeI/OmpD-associated family protein [Ilumatobacteraceae bacterium]|nr:YdeI/OmpD-associated family protein [Ilumatobacteraceae bacterium]